VSDRVLCFEREPGAAPARPWRRTYWHWRSRAARFLRECTVQTRLARLRLLARTRARFRAGCVRSAGLRIQFDDALSLYMEYKHIFAWGIYDFRPLGPRPRVLDCGGHIGLSTLRFKQIAPDCRVTVFEPDERVLPLLRGNVENNGLRDVEIVAAGLAAQRGKAGFVEDGADGGAVVRNGYTPPGVKSVPTVPLSDYLDEPVDFLKMNIEGLELEVLREAAGKLHRVRQLVIEYHGFPQLGQGLHELLELLHESGFRYSVHHFDYETNPALRPPFRMHESTRFFQLIAATRLWDRTATSPSAAAAPTTATALQPLSRTFGFDRGQPIDRHYIETFLLRHAGDIRGRVLEVGGDTYTRRFGGSNVVAADVLHVRDTSATIVADLTHCPQIPDGRYDCVVLTQTLPFIYDTQAALANVRRILKPGGVLLLSVPGISQRSAYDAQRWGDFWRFTPLSVERLLTRHFPASAVAVQAFGNVRTATALLEGRAAHEIDAAALEFVDDDYPVIIAARAQRPADGAAA
jgi:FkbM family methyltransferase